MIKRQHSQSAQEEIDSIPRKSRSNSSAFEDDKESLFSTIVDHKLIRSISITNTCKEVDSISIHKKHYVIYTIEIKTDYFDYSIHKRYSEFLKLHDQIQHIMPYLPKFPEKKIFQSNSKKNIAERRDLLEQFLQILLKNLNNRLHRFLHFLNIKEQFSKVGMGQNLRIHELSKDELSLADLRDTQKQKKFIPSNDQEKMVNHYITKLNEKYDERGKIFSKMEKYFFGKMHLISTNFLKYIFIGDEENDILGMFQLLRANNTSQQNHISCVSGMQFLRKILEFDYNPCADNALKVFGELNLKQFKNLKIENHVAGALSKMCKQDALTLLFKYVNYNQLKPEFIGYIIDDQSTIDEFSAFQETYQKTKKDETFQMVFDSMEISQTSSAPTKSTSKEQAQILDLEPSLEQLEEMYHRNMSWKQVQEHKGHSISHIQGQFVKTIHKFKSMEQALDLMTTQKSKWLFYMSEGQFVEDDKNDHKISIESHIWLIKQLYKRVVFISDQSIEYKVQNLCKMKDNEIIVKISPLGLEECNKYLNEFKEFELSQKYSFIIIKQESDYVSATSVQNLVDKNFKQAYTPILLKENDIFQQTIDKLCTLIGI